MKRREREKTKHETESGFTLIEVLIAMAVLAVGLLGLAMMQAHFAEGNATSRQIIRATDLITDKIEEFTNITDPSNSAFDVGAHAETVVDNRNYTRSWNVSANTDGTRTIDFTVTWNSGGRNHNVDCRWIKAF